MTTKNLITTNEVDKKYNKYNNRNSCSICYDDNNDDNWMKDIVSSMACPQNKIKTSQPVALVLIPQVPGPGPIATVGSSDLPHRPGRSHQCHSCVSHSHMCNTVLVAGSRGNAIFHLRYKTRAVPFIRSHNLQIAHKLVSSSLSLHIGINRAD